MKLTKDEARILGEVLRDGKYDINKSEVPISIMDKFVDLENRLLEFGKDNRRTGRTSMDSFTDCLKRFANKK